MNSVCSKCNGPMYLNSDKDLSCFMCGTIVVLTIRRHADKQGIRKKVEDKITKWRMVTDGTQRKKGQPRKFLGKR